MTQFLVARLSRGHDAKSFDCGDEELNSYLRRYALQNQERHSAAVTYVASTEGSSAIAAYYTLSNASLHRSRVPESKLSPYAEIPAVLLGRLAVDVRHQSQGLGRRMLRDAILRSQHLRSLSGCRCLLVDAYAMAVPWYERFGFVRIEETQPPGTVRLYLDLRRLIA